jgi:hypothetical protein
MWSHALLPPFALAAMVLMTVLLIGRTVDCDATRLRPGSGMCIAHAPAVTIDPAIQAALDAEPQAGADRRSAESSSFRFSELRSRLVWGISVVFVFLTAGGLLLISASTLDILPHRVARAGLRAVILAVVIIVLVLYLRELDHSYGFNEALIGATVYKVTFAAPFVAIVEALGHSALIAVALATGCVMYQAASDRWRAPGSIEEQAATLAVALRRIQLLLFMAALATAAGAIQSTALYSWTMTMLEQSQYLTDAKDLPATLGGLIGAFYSILLAGIFAPALFIMAAWANQIADTAVTRRTELTRAEWLAKRDIDISLSRRVISALTVLAPLIAGGPLSQLIKALVG